MCFLDYQISKHKLQNFMNFLAFIERTIVDAELCIFSSESSDLS